MGLHYEHLGMKLNEGILYNTYPLGAWVYSLLVIEFETHSITNQNVRYLWRLTVDK